jgi:hypothetical protein
MRLALASLVLVSAAAHAQQQPRYGCDSPESKQLDFWVGEWELSYKSGDKTAQSRNRITKTLDGCAVLEEFNGPPGTPLVGRSYSVFDRASRQWKQTWVDNTGAYLDLVGGPLPDGRMHFARETMQNGKKVRARMVWDDVKADSLRWTWQRSVDDGATWSNAWEIEYRRAK